MVSPGRGSLGAAVARCTWRVRDPGRPTRPGLPRPLGRAPGCGRPAAPRPPGERDLMAAAVPLSPRAARLYVVLAALTWSTSGAFTKVLREQTPLGLNVP